MDANHRQRPPDTVLESQQPSARDLNGRPPDPVVDDGDDDDDDDGDEVWDDAIKNR